jgi:hypothetical protein
MRPDIAAKVAASAGNFTGSKGADALMDPKLKAQFAKSFSEEALKNVKWYPAVPPGIEDIEGKGARSREGRKLSRATREALPTSGRRAYGASPAILSRSRWPCSPISKSTA